MLIHFSRKYNLFVDYKKEKHKRFATNLRSYSIGGILLITFFTYTLILNEKNYLSFFFLFSIFLIGLFSDLKKLNSVNLRFFLQIVIIILFIFFLDLKIIYTRIDFFDSILQNNILINIIFTTFCVLIIVNGSNFIDGVNSLNVGYFLIILFVIFNLGSHGIDTGTYLNIINSIKTINNYEDQSQEDSHLYNK